jgi:hypothetical protein
MIMLCLAFLLKYKNKGPFDLYTPSFRGKLVNQTHHHTHEKDYDHHVESTLYADVTASHLLCLLVSRLQVALYLVALG